MGSTAMMEETTRRRRPTSNSRRRRSEIQSGGPIFDDDLDGDDMDAYHSRRYAANRNTEVKSRFYTSKRRQKKRRQLSSSKKDEVPFYILAFQVGTVLLLLISVTYHIYRFIVPSRSSTSLQPYTVDDDDNNNQEIIQRQEQTLKLNQLLHKDKNRDKIKSNIQQQSRKATLEIHRTAPPLPKFDLSIASEWDAYGIQDKVFHMKEEESKNDNMNRKSSKYIQLWNAIQTTKKQFINLYGGENAARMLLDQGLTTFPQGQNHVDDNNYVPSDIIATACRLKYAKLHHRPFRMAFGGYSVTTGRGNHHKDSYPYQIQTILQPILQLVGIPSIQVHNAAIGGCPSFPYGWCMKEFWGITRTKPNDDSSHNDTIHTPDVVSWDFSMNEATGGPEGLEAYIRHLLATYSMPVGADTLKSSTTRTTIEMSPPPKLIVKDYSTATFRKQVLAEYAHLLQDVVMVHTDRIVQPFLAREEDFRPLGFQHWRDFGAPKGAPGQALHHPAVQEHKLNGWIIAMHFLSALEYMMMMEEKPNVPKDNPEGWCPRSFQDNDPTQVNLGSPTSSAVILPPPISGRIVNDTKMQYDSILFGKPIYKSNSLTMGSPQEWIMSPIQCRTSFQPKVSGDLTEIVVNGTIAEDLDVILPKSQFYYNKGWTYDLSESEKATKRKLNLYPNSLGFCDSKEAYYGIYESPRMTLFLPYENNAVRNLGATIEPKIGDIASDWYESIILCQVNDRTLDNHPDGCNFATDIGIKIGGVNVTTNSTKMIHTIGSIYLGKPICKHAEIPLQSRLTSHNQLLMGKEKPTGELIMEQLGLLIEIFVTNIHIVHIHQACSISHVIWEERKTGDKNDKIKNLT